MSMTAVSATYQQSPSNPAARDNLLNGEFESQRLSPPSECNPLLKQAFHAVYAQAGDTCKIKR